MIQIACNHCGKDYRVDESQIRGDSAKMKCQECGMFIIIEKPAPSMNGPDPAGSPAAATLDEASADSASVRDAAKASADRTRVKFGLTTRMILLMLMISLVPLALFGVISYRQTEAQIRHDTVGLMEQTAAGLTSQVNEWIDKNVRVLQAAAKLDAIVSLERGRQEPVLRALHEVYPWMYLVFTLGPDGMNTARSDEEGLKDYSDRQYYKDVAQGKAVAWQTLIGKTSKKPALVLAVPIISGGKLAGVMAAAMTIDEISKNVATWRKGKTGFAFLVDEKGKVVAHQIEEFVVTQKKLSDNPLVAAFLSKQKPTTMSFRDDSGQLTLGHVRGTDYGWALAIRQEHLEVFAPLKKIQLFALALFAVTAVLVLLIATLSARTLVRPITKLTDVAERMSMGDLDVQIDVHSRDEIGMLAQAVERMQTSLRMAMDRLRRRR